MKRILSVTVIAAAMIAAATSCRKDEIVNLKDIQNEEGLVFCASLEEDATKTTISSEGYKISWESTDTISINGVKFVPSKIDEVNGSYANFKKASNETQADPTAPFYAYYPASIYDTSSRKTSLPSVQVYNKEGNVAGVVPMYACNNTTGAVVGAVPLNFRNLCGLLKFTLKGTEKVRYITLSDSLKGLCGEFTVDNDTAKLNADTERVLTLDCGEAGVLLDGTTGKDFYVALPAGSYEHLAIRYTTPSGAMCSKKASGTAVIERNKVYAFGQTPEFHDYLCFTCTGGNVTIGMKKIEKSGKTAPEVSLLYYTDRTGWQDVKIADGKGGVPDSTSVTLAPDEKVYFKAKTTNDSLAASTNAYNFFTTETDDNGKVDVSGNIMTLLNGGSPASVLTHTYAFSRLFIDCKAIGNASELKLPATTLADYCYNSMFNGCTSLTSAPSLPATELAQSCYASMFNGCTSLTSAPSLPATELAQSCYTSMFNDCTSLTSAPSLPATTLAGTCYSTMFYGCTSLTTAPSLPADSLVNKCYFRMFNGCSKLSSVTMLATKLSAKDCLTEWLKDAGTSSGVTNKIFATKAGADWLDKNSTYKYGWTVVEVLPGVFSVSATKKVRFSKGNLQATCTKAGLQGTSEYSWGFAENQYDTLGRASGNMTIADQTLGAKVDLFGWVAESGTLNGDATKYGIYRTTTQTYTTDYGNVLGENLKADWGTAIDNDGTWQSLTMDEVAYLFSFDNPKKEIKPDFSNPTRKGLHADSVTVVGHKNCIVLYPDGFTGTKVSNRDETAYNTQEKWAAAEAAGVVCLPAAGSRSISTIKKVGEEPFYWTKQSPDFGNNEVEAYCFGVYERFYNATKRMTNASVRLVTEVK